PILGWVGRGSVAAALAVHVERWDRERVVDMLSPSGQWRAVRDSRVRDRPGTGSRSYAQQPERQSDSRGTRTRSGGPGATGAGGDSRLRVGQRDGAARRGGPDDLDQR